MPSDPRFAESQSRIPLQQLPPIAISMILSSPGRRTHPTNQTLRILVHGLIFGERELVLQHADIHIRVIISPERRL
jgi:hypothetical protein